MVDHNREETVTRKRWRWNLFEDSLSVVALLTMALLPLLEIFIRKFYARGIPGSTIWVQHLALWVAFLGAAIASRRGELLSLTAGAGLLRGRVKTATQIFTAGISFAVCAVLASGSLELVNVEREGGRVLALDLPVWIAQIIMPIGFAVIGLEPFQSPKALQEPQIMQRPLIGLIAG